MLLFMAFTIFTCQDNADCLIIVRLSKILHFMIIFLEILVLNFMHKKCLMKNYVGIFLNPFAMLTSIDKVLLFFQTEGSFIGMCKRIWDNTIRL